eukprot:3958673-Pyramimonas_sp.AAC.1
MVPWQSMWKKNSLTYNQASGTVEDGNIFSIPRNLEWPQVPGYGSTNTSKERTILIELSEGPPSKPREGASWDDT